MRSSSTHRKGRKRRLQSATELKRQTFYALENIKEGNLAAKVVGSALFALILANAVVVFVTTGPEMIDLTATVVKVFYRISTVCFMVEYFARLWIADLVYGNLSPARARIKYMVSVMGIIDLLSFLPSLISWFVPMSRAVLHAISVIRLVRVVKISRYMRGLSTIGRVVKKRRSEIVAAFLVILFLMFMSSVIMYEIENPAQPEKFDNLLTGLYWAATTITGTGYGDIAPITTAGRLIGSLMMLLSITLVAIPGGIFSAGFVAEFQNYRYREIERDMRKMDSSKETKGQKSEKAADEGKTGESLE